MKITHAIKKTQNVRGTAMNPDTIVPFHTEYPDDYRESFGSKVRCLRDGDVYNVNA